MMMMQGGDCTPSTPTRHICKKDLWTSSHPPEESYARLLAKIEEETKTIKALGSESVPQIQFSDLANVSESTIQEIKKRGVCIIRGVVDPKVVGGWAEEAENYVTKDNNYHGTSDGPQKTDEFFAQATPQIYGVYWNKPQVQARQHPNMQTVRGFMNRLWSWTDDKGKWAFDPDKEATYADRQRIRLPGNVSGLVPHIDGGSVERWMDPGYQKFYANIYSGEWEKHDSWNGSVRVNTEEFPSPNVCTVFRSFQGWLALSSQGPGDGTLQVVPLVKESIAHLLLRPFLSDVLSDDNNFCGALEAKQHQIHDTWHASLLANLVTIPRVHPGDTVWWHPDLIHAVERHHNGTGKSSVLYIGAVPLCEKSAKYLVGQREAFVAGKAGPDFPQEDKEVGWKGKGGVEDLSELGACQMGFKAWPLNGKETPEQVQLLERVKVIIEQK